eukprot:6040873-Pyramimonas_sp.AAC.1
MVKSGRGAWADDLRRSRFCEGANAASSRAEDWDRSLQVRVGVPTGLKQIADAKEFFSRHAVGGLTMRRNSSTIKSDLAIEG